jgi:hypothetical protein
MLPRALKTNHPGVPVVAKSINGNVLDNVVVVFHGNHVKCSKQHAQDAGRLRKCLLNQQVRSLFIVKTATNPADRVSKTIPIDYKSSAVIRCRAFYNSFFLLWNYLLFQLKFCKSICKG